jgi:hypothetical protein
MYEIYDIYDKSKIGMLKGVVAILAGVIITLISYNQASVSDGRYMIMYGLVIYGFVRLVKSLYVFIKCRKYVR